MEAGGKTVGRMAGWAVIACLYADCKFSVVLHSYPPSLVREEPKSYVTLSDVII